MALVEPTILLSDPRNDGGDAVASAKTDDGGVAFVRWDPAAKSWVIDNDFVLEMSYTSSTTYIIFYFFRNSLA